MKYISSRAYPGPLAKIVNISSPFVIVLIFEYTTLILLIQITMKIVRSCIFLILVLILDNIGKELVIIMSIAGYTQIIENVTYYTNHSPS